MKNEELINRMRMCVNGDCEGCNYQYVGLTNTEECKEDLLYDAVDLLEATDRLLDQNTERCEELRKQLREAHENYEKHLNELQAKLDEAENSIKNYKDLYLSRKREELLLAQQIPKEGEWIWDSDTGTYNCSECNATSPREDQDGEYIDCPNFCPNCGAKMRGERSEEP